MPFVLTWAVLICGAVWLFDVAVLKPRRMAAVAGAKREGDRPGFEAKSRDEAAEEPPEPLLVEYARSFFPVLLFVLVLRSFLAEPYQIPSESMVPTLAVGDFVLVNKYAYGIRLPVLGTKIIPVGEPQRGDVMVFIPPHDPRYFIKRVIGVPGDVIRYENKALFINGERAAYEFVDEFEERYALGTIPVRSYVETFDGRSHQIYRYPKNEATGEWTVPEGSYFMMGDNRGKSADSREWGFAHESNIVGKAVAIWVHKDPGLSLPTFERNRWLD